MFMSSIKPQVYFKFNPQLLPESKNQGDNKLMVDIGIKIKNALKDKELTQRWLAEKMDVSDNAVKKWIRSGQINSTHYKKLSSLLNIPIYEFISDIIDDETLEALKMLQDKQILAITKSVFHISPTQKTAVLHTSNAFTEPAEGTNGK